MPYNPNIHHRRSIRLKGYDYSQAGLYFITICTQNRNCLFGEIINHKMILNQAGQMIETEWLKLPKRFTNIQLHEYVVMPNHFHAILEIVDQNNVVDQNKINQYNMITQHATVNQNASDERNEKGQTQGFDPTNKTVGDMVGAYESITTVEYIRGVKNNNWQPFNKKLWQRNYWEHIIRDEKSYKTISDYIINNPLKWDNDKLK